MIFRGGYTLRRIFLIFLIFNFARVDLRLVCLPCASSLNRLFVYTCPLLELYDNLYGTHTGRGLKAAVPETGGGMP